MQKRNQAFRKLLEMQREFVRAREWERFHTPKNLAMALAGEAGELLEIFQWLTAEESYDVPKDKKKLTALQHEIADIFYYLMRLADVLGVDMEKAFLDKMKENARKYPVKLSKGTAKKYTELST